MTSFRGEDGGQQTEHLAGRQVELWGSLGWSSILRPHSSAPGTLGVGAQQLSARRKKWGDELEIRPPSFLWVPNGVNPPGSLPLPARVGVGVKGQLRRPLRDLLGQVAVEEGMGEESEVRPAGNDLEPLAGGRLKETPVGGPPPSPQPSRGAMGRASFLFPSLTPGGVLGRGEAPAGLALAWTRVSETRCGWAITRWFLRGG